MNELEGLILRYWGLSIESRLSSFNFEKTFKLFRIKIKEKLGSHGMLGLEDYVDGVEKYYDVNVLKQFAYHSFHTEYRDGYEEILKRLFKPRYEHFRSIYIEDPIYNRILKVYQDLETPPFDTKSQTLLMERAINCAHRDGMFIDIEALREKYNENIIRLSTDTVFGILNRSGLEIKMRNKNTQFNAIFIDFNNMKELNEKHGYEEVNKKIRKKLKKLKRDECVLGRWFSGDEVVVISFSDFDKPFLETLNKLSVRGTPKFKYWMFLEQNNMDELKSNISKISKVDLRKSMIVDTKVS